MWSLGCLCTKVHVHKQIHLRNARHLRWGKLFAHTLLKCWLDTLMSSSFPLCNSSSYQPFTSDFCPAGTCTSSVSGCTPPYVSIRPCNHLVVESRGGVIYTHFKHFHVKVSTLYLSTMSPLDIRGEVCGFWFLAVLIPGTPTRKGWGWVGAFGVSKTEWSRPHPTPNNSFAPFWQMGNKPLPNARPLLQRQKDHQQTKCFGSVNVIVSECYCNITTIKNAGAKGYWEYKTRNLNQQWRAIPALRSSKVGDVWLALASGREAQELVAWTFQNCLWNKSCNALSGRTRQQNKKKNEIWYQNTCQIFCSTSVLPQTALCEVLHRVKLVQFLLECS